jgi:glycosyltransferase involved in cell wall biosynthesis
MLKEEVVALGIAPRVRELGWIPNEDLVFAYNSAEALVLPSQYEGFGFPALEAMACGTPVIVSDAGSLPEIVGDAALVSETGNPGSLADAMRTICTDSALRMELIAKGKRNAAKFSWKETAEKTLQVYESVL